MGYFGDGILISLILWRSIVVEGDWLGSVMNKSQLDGW